MFEVTSCCLLRFLALDSFINDKYLSISLSLIIFEFSFNAEFVIKLVNNLV
jgi:hypothetical protein